MALIKCPECDLQVSDHAIACPHCGYPLQTTAAKKQRTKQRRRKKLPNGFGQISEIKTGNLYKPFRAMVTVGKDFYGRPIRKLLKPVAFFKAYNDAKTHRSILKLIYDKYRHRADKIIKKLKLNPEHRAHDGRIQFATMAKAADVNEYAIKRIMGHKIDDLTEKTYTKRKREWLPKDKIEYCIITKNRVKTYHPGSVFLLF